jgi:glycosyltransferase involved in cell wall biosynthesis
MRVVLINDQLNAGGAERVLVNMANLLYKNDIDVSVVLFLKPSALDHQINKNISITYLNRKRRFALKPMLKLKHLVRNADIVHVHSRHNLRYYMVARYLVGLRGHKVAFHEHVPDYASIDMLTAWLLKQTDAYIGVQERLCTWVKEKQLVPADKIFFLPNIVTKPVASVKANHEQKRMLMVANFRKIKNQVFALAVLKALGPAYKLDFYGIIDESDYYNEILDFIAKHGLEQQAKIITGVTDIYEVLPAYELALHTATNETGPLVLLEYMNFGLPFLTYNTGEVVPNVKAEVPQLVINSFEVNEWVERINSVIDQREGKPLLQQQMKNIIANNYSEEKYWERLKHIYSKTLAEA